MRTRRVVTCLLEHNGRLLVLRRSQSVRTYRGKWAGVSGSVDGPSPLEQALEEIVEETGLLPGDVEHLREGDPLDVVDETLGVRWVVHPFLPGRRPTRICLDWEHDQSRWIDPSDISELDTVPGLKETWDRLHSPVRSSSE